MTKNNYVVQVSKEYFKAHHPYGSPTLQYYEFFVSISGNITHVNKWPLKGGRYFYTVKGDYADIYDAANKKAAIGVALLFLLGKKKQIERYKRQWYSSGKRSHPAKRVNISFQVTGD